MIYNNEERVCSNNLYLHDLKNIEKIASALNVIFYWHTLIIPNLLLIMEGEWLMSSIEGLEDFPLFTDCQKQRILDDLTDKKLKLTTNIKRVEDFIRFNRKWRLVVLKFNNKARFDIRYPEI